MGDGSCSLCELGTHKSTAGPLACEPCATDRITLKTGTTSKDDCVCKEDRVDSGGECKACALINGAICDAPGTTVHSLLLKESYWRISPSSLDIRRCRGSACPGGEAATCVANQTGPLCEVCTESRHYLDEGTGLCTNCPPAALLPVVFVVVAGVIGLAIFAFYGLNRRPARSLSGGWRQRLKHLFKVTYLLLPKIRAPLKQLVAFYQARGRLRPTRVV